MPGVGAAGCAVALAGRPGSGATGVAPASGAGGTRGAGSDGTTGARPARVAGLGGSTDSVRFAPAPRVPRDLRRLRPSVRVRDCFGGAGGATGAEGAAGPESAGGPEGAASGVVEPVGGRFEESVGTECRAVRTAGPRSRGDSGTGAEERCRPSNAGRRRGSKIPVPPGGLIGERSGWAGSTYAGTWLDEYGLGLVVGPRSAGTSSDAVRGALFSGSWGRRAADRTGGPRGGRTERPAGRAWKLAIALRHGQQHSEVMRWT
ncbi:MAG TPA: hypothetical protein VI248_10415 [Kineosporiaceae bacterium]